jgi:cell division protein FtsB
MKISFSRLLYALAGLLAAGYAAFVIRGPHGIPALAEKMRQVSELEAKNAELARENQAIKRRIERLAGNPAEQELEIRKKLKLVRPDEKIFVLPGSKP